VRRDEPGAAPQRLLFDDLMKAKRTLVGALAVVAAWGALWVARPSEVLQPGPAPTRADPRAEFGVQPLAFHGIYECPGGMKYAGYAQGAIYYPPNHPLRPRLIVEPSRCFANPVEAELAGYSLAPPPPGTQVVEGFYMAPVDTDLKLQCEAAARDLGFDVPCPSTLPTPGFGIDPPSCGIAYETAPRSCVYEDSFVLNYQSFEAPPGYSQLRDITHGTHLFVAALPTGRMRSLFTNRYGFLFCPGSFQQGRLLTSGETVVQHVRAVYVDCGDASAGSFFGLGLNAGHVVLMWSLDNRSITYLVSLHGQTDVNRQLARYIADSMEYVAPGG
jgi:hypothetical protein